MTNEVNPMLNFKVTCVASERCPDVALGCCSNLEINVVIFWEGAFGTGQEARWLHTSQR